MADSFQMKQGDTRPKIVITLYSDSAKTSPVDLTNASTITLKVGDGTTLHVDKVMSIVGAATDGKVEYQWAAGDTDFDTGGYDMEVEVVWDDTTVATYPRDGFLSFTLSADLDPAA